MKVFEGAVTESARTRLWVRQTFDIEGSNDLTAVALNQVARCFSTVIENTAVAVAVEQNESLDPMRVLLRML